MDTEEGRKEVSVSLPKVKKTESKVKTIGDKSNGKY